MVVEDKSLREYVGCMRGAREDILTQLPCYNRATGEVKEAYKRVLLDKLWRVSQLCGTFYYEVLGAVGELEKEFLSVVPVGEGRYVLPQFEEEFRKWKEEMKKVMMARC